MRKFLWFIVCDGNGNWLEIIEDWYWMRLGFGVIVGMLFWMVWVFVYFLSEVNFGFVFKFFFYYWMVLVRFFFGLWWDIFWVEIVEICWLSWLEWFVLVIFLMIYVFLSFVGVLRIIFRSLFYYVMVNFN